jgi:proteasome lid subunit RPN8/RPN11
MILRIANRQLTLLEREAQEKYPVEACALLFGKPTEKEVAIKRIAVTPNVLESAVRFEIDSKAFYDAFTKANKHDLDFVGFFHSHQAPAEPSSVDLQFMRLWGDAVWLIFSYIEHRFAAFQMRNGEVRTLTLKPEAKLKE